MEIKELHGNRELLRFNKTAFLCGRKSPALVLLKKINE